MSTGAISSRGAPAFLLNLSCKRGDEQGAPGLARSHFFSDSRKETGSELGQVGRGEAPRWVPTPQHIWSPQLASGALPSKERTAAVLGEKGGN